MFEIQNFKVVNEGKAGVPIHTGIGYLDHMIDQLNSHAQVGVGLEVHLTSCSNGENDVTNKNRLANIPTILKQADLCAFIGTQLGTALKGLVSSSVNNNNNNSNNDTQQPTLFRFCCPLDEALVECIITPSSTASTSTTGSLESYTLAPFGIYPKTFGRSKIGQLETLAIESFWKSLAESFHVQLTFHKLRGDNGHHIVESSFKAFSRALRNYLDNDSKMFDVSSENHKASIALNRHAKIERSTKETSIRVELLLDGGNNSKSIIDTGIPILDEFFTCLAEEAHMTLNIQCKGDLWVDDHHTAEDVSIAVGQCLNQALGTKAGLNRMWLAEVEYGSNNNENAKAKVEVTMDLSNRPCLRHNLHETLGRREYITTTNNTEDNNGNHGSLLSCEMLEHVLDSLVMNGRMTVHIVEKQPQPGTATTELPSVKDTVLCTAKAFGQALFVCAMVDLRRAGQTASSKGTLSV